MGRLGLIAGSSFEESELPAGDWEAVRRHDADGAYVLPHQLDHARTMRALIAAGCDRVLALSSVGSLREELAPGTLVCPDDFIALDAGAVTALQGAGAHVVPSFDDDWRGRVLAELAGAGADVVDGGVYWQTRGPRLETPAEIRMLRPHAELIGMTIGTECVVACELGLRYAALCSVDNLASGLGGEALTLAEIERNRAAHATTLTGVLGAVLPALAADA